MPIADWTVPFLLTSQVYSSDLLPFNTNVATVLPSGSTGYYFLNESSCSLTNSVRETKDNIPQANGSILHRRWVQGMEMNLAVQLWQTPDDIACDDLQQEMLDFLMGYLYGLLNAVDNQGRISWVPSGVEARMLDNLRLLSYPVESHPPGSPMELTFSLDTQYPYELALTQRLTTITSGGSAVLVNTGTVPVHPVIQVNMNNTVPIAAPCADFILTDNFDAFEWTSSLPGSAVIASGDYAELDSFRNTMFLNGDEANLSPGIDMLVSEYLTLYPGSNTISITGTDCDVLWNPGWA